MGTLEPLEECSHLKRIRRRQIPGESEAILDVILTLKGESGYDRASALMRELGLTGSVEEVEVSARAPVLRAQYDIWNPLWPLVFHDVRKGLPDLQADDAASIAFMEQARQHARECRGSVSSGAVLVDPINGRVVCGAADGRDDHPLHHAVMQCLDAKARIDRSSTEPKSKRKLPDQDGSGYLCNGLDMYVTREPCVMCSMALVHSRIRCVYIDSRNEQFGGLVSLFNVAEQKGLNHHFDVFYLNHTD